MTTSCLNDNAAQSTDTVFDDLPHCWAEVGRDGEVTDALWVERNTPSREVLQQRVRKCRPPQEWYDAEMECPF